MNVDARSYEFLLFW